MAEYWRPRKSSKWDEFRQSLILAPMTWQCRLPINIAERMCCWDPVSQNGDGYRPGESANCFGPTMNFSNVDGGAGTAQGWLWDVPFNLVPEGVTGWTFAFGFWGSNFVYPGTVLSFDNTQWVEILETGLGYAQVRWVNAYSTLTATVQVLISQKPILVVCINSDDTGLRAIYINGERISIGVGTVSLSGISKVYVGASALTSARYSYNGDLGPYLLADYPWSIETIEDWFTDPIGFLDLNPQAYDRIIVPSYTCPHFDAAENESVSMKICDESAVLFDSDDDIAIIYNHDESESISVSFDDAIAVDLNEEICDGA